MKQKSDFRRLHEQEGCFLIPNPWDAGTARILASLGYSALATTSAGMAFALGVSAMGGCHKKPHWRIAVIW